MGPEHHFLLCPEEECAVPLLKFIKDQGIEVAERFLPPGSQTPQLFATHEIRIILRKVASNLYGLHHLCGKTVGKNFDLDNIWVTVHKEVKFKDVVLRDAISSRVTYTLNRLSQLIRKQLFFAKLPADIEQWLDLMESDKASDMEYCICYNPSIMADYNKFEFFMRAYKHLWPIKSLLRDTYDDIIRGLPYEIDWPTLILENNFLSAVYLHIDKNGKPVLYDARIPGLMQFLKNCDSHLHEKAVVNNSKLPLFST